MFQALRFPFDCRWNERDDECRIGIAYFKQCTLDVDDSYTQLFRELAPSGIDIRFAGLTFPTWKLPESAMSLMRWSLANEETIAVRNDCGNDSNGMRSHCDELARPIRCAPGESWQHMLRASIARRGCYVFRAAPLNTSRNIRPRAVR